MAAAAPLSRLESSLNRAARDLDDLGRRWALVGGLAVSAQVEPRFTRDSGIEPEIVSEAEIVDLLPDFRVPVATIGHLIALEILARDDATRPMDRADLIALIKAAGPQDISQARAALAVIRRRGFQRGKDLEAELEQILRAARSRP